MEPLISVIVPVYNTKEYLKKCIKSIVNQTYQNLELLLVDDGATDGSGKLCDQLALTDSRIRVFHKTNGGSSSARNLGIRESKGEYLGFVDSDDYVDSNMYEQLIHAAMDYNVSIVQVGRDEVAENGEMLPNICEPPLKEQKETSKEFMRELLLHKGDCSFCTKLVKKALFQIGYFPEGVLNEDFHLLVQMLPHIEALVSLPTQSYHVYYRSNSNTRTVNVRTFSRVYGDNVDNADMVQEIVRGNFPELSAIAMRFGLYQRLDYLLHIPVEQMNSNNKQYTCIVHYLRKHLRKVCVSQYLSGKNKLYLILLSIAPRNIRRLHQFIRN